MIKSVFLKHLFNMSDPQLEDLLKDLLSFKQSDLRVFELILQQRIT